MSDYIKYEVRVYPSGTKAIAAARAKAKADGDKHWCLDGKSYTESEHKAEMERRCNTCNGKTVIIEGKEYTVTEVKK